MRVAWFDCGSGASGDMLCAALIDAGGPTDLLRTAIERMGLGGEVRATARRVRAGNLVATRLRIRIADGGRRQLTEAKAAVVAGRFSPDVTRRSIADLERLAQTEGALHGMTAADVHLHELSAADTLIDIAAFHLLLEALRVDDVQASPVNVGGGRFTTSHGEWVAPAPATAALLRGAPVFGKDDAGELTTPTGALLLSGRASRFGALPQMRLESVGSGAGTREAPRPSILRCFIGTVADAPEVRLEQVVLLESNIDDLNPQVYEEVFDRLFAAGALDVFLVPMIAKRGRPGVVVGVLATPELGGELANVLFSETSTLGVRTTTVERYVLDRWSDIAETSFGPIRVKVAQLPSGGRRTVPEFADIRRVASEQGIPVAAVARRVGAELVGRDEV